VSDGEATCQTPNFTTGSSYCVLTPLSAGPKTLTATFTGIADISAPSQGTAPLTVVGPAVDGVCGSDDGKTLATTPTNLCSAGTQSAVSASGPWTWSCAGSNNGSTARCSAQLQTKAATTTTLQLSPNPGNAGS